MTPVLALRVDIASGATVLDRTDLRLPGALPLVLARSYRSGAPSGIFGVGWRHELDRTLRVEADRVVYADGAGRETSFAPVAVGMEARHPEGLTLQHHAEDYVVYASPHWQEVFSKRGTAGPLLPLAKIEDGNGNRLQLTYSGGRLSEIADPEGRRIRFGYTGANVTQLVLAGAGSMQPIRSFRYGPGGTLVAETDATGGTTEYAYQDGLLVRATDPNGAVWHAQYDAERRCIAVWSGDGTIVRHFAYDPLRQTTRVVGTDGEQTIYRHLLGRQVIEAIDVEGESQNFYYDEAQRLIGYTLADGTVQVFRRLDADAGTLFQIEGEQRFAEATIGASGLVATVADAFENTYRLGYDERFNLATLTMPGGGVWTMERDRQGRVVRVESPMGQAAQFQRDGSTLRVVCNDRVVHTVVTDAFGRVVKRGDALGRETVVRYDPEGRVTALECGAYRMTLAYDRAGRLIRLADSDRRDTRWQRDVAGRVVAIESAGRGALRFGYDLTGRLAEASGNGTSLRFSCDAQDRLRVAESPQTRTTFAYDDGKVAITTDAETRVYDVFGDLVERRAPGGEATTYQYDPRGALLAVEPADGVATLIEYDADGRLDRFERGDDTLVFAHDAGGTLVAIEDGLGRHGILEYDAHNHIALVRMAASHFRLECDAAGNLTAVHPPEGAPCSIAYDELGRPLSTTRGADRSVVREDAPEVLRLYEATGPGDDNGALGLVVGRSGLVLVAWFGTLAVPLWIQSEVRCPLPDPTYHTVQALVHGADRAVGKPPSDDDLLGWIRRCTQALGTGAPTPDLLGAGWSALDFFALAPGFYSPHLAWRQQHRAEPPEGRSTGLTGAHHAFLCYPPLWQPRGGTAQREAPVLLDGRLTPARAALLFQALTALRPA